MKKQEQECKYIYDIGLVYRSNHNYGANLTHYSLYQFLCSQGYRVLMIDLPSDSKCALPIDRPDPLELFEDCPYSKESIAYPIKHRWDLLEMNALCRFFLVGSDQLWRRYFVVDTNYFSTLDWVSDEKYKISYATSFGVDNYEGNQEEKEAIGRRLSRLHRISVRESSGVKIVSELTGRESQWVADPVFICAKRCFDILAKKGSQRMPLHKYVAAYLLDRDAFKNEYVRRMKLKKNICESVLIEDAMVTHSYSDKDELNPIRHATVEEWLAMIKNCEFLVTDSFHGMCFALIFKKQFVIIISKESHRGYARVESLLTMLGLKSRIVHECSDEKGNDISDQPIDYKIVDAKLCEFAKKGRNWLLDSLELANQYKEVSDENITWISEKVQKDIEKEKMKYAERIECIERRGAGVLKKNSPVYIWGAGACFKRNIKVLSEIYRIVGVVDSDSGKWGKEVAKNIFCISPQKIFSMSKNVAIIILIEDPNISRDISNKLRTKGIMNCITYGQLIGFE